MRVRQTNWPQDKVYFRELKKQHPHLSKFIDSIPGRFDNIMKRTPCDGKCGSLMLPEEMNIFVSPAPEYKPLLLCRVCLKSEYGKVAANGDYDIHERHLDKNFKK